MASSFGLDALPRALLALPAPVHPLDRLRAALGGPARCPRLWIQRDDLNGIAFGGNKLRKLEFLLGEAQVLGADTLLTAGAAQSNHARQTAGVGAIFGLETHLLLRGPEPAQRTGNLILDDWLGAKLHFAPPGQSVAALLEPLAQELRAAGRNPYVIPIGGSNAVGAVGFAAAVRELSQTTTPDFLVCATGSGGTQAGLEVGVRLFAPRTRVLGVGVAEPDTERWEDDVAGLANAVATRLGAPITVSPEEIHCPMDWMGERYGVPTPAGQAALERLARTEGIFLDPVYSAKAFAALLDWIDAGRFTPDQSVLFWHTGGAPALFA